MRNKKVEMRNLLLRTAALLLLIFFDGCGSSTKEASEDVQAENLQKLPLIERFDFEDLEGNKIEWAETMHSRNAFNKRSKYSIKGGRGDVYNSFG